MGFKELINVLKEHFITLPSEKRERIQSVLKFYNDNLDDLEDLIIRFCDFLLKCPYFVNSGRSILYPPSSDSVHSFETIEIEFCKKLRKAFVKYLKNNSKHFPDDLLKKLGYYAHFEMITETTLNRETSKKEEAVILYDLGGTGRSSNTLVIYTKSLSNSTPIGFPSSINDS